MEAWDYLVDSEDYVTSRSAHRYEGSLRTYAQHTPLIIIAKWSGVWVYRLYILDVR